MKIMVSTLGSSSVYPSVYTKAGISCLDHLKQCSKYGKKKTKREKNGSEGAYEHKQITINRYTNLVCKNSRADKTKSYIMFINVQQLFFRVYNVMHSLHFTNRINERIIRNLCLKISKII